jgi:hypothetical protein
MAATPGRRTRAALALVLFFGCIGPLFPYPINSWKHIRTFLFTVTYCERTEHLAARALQIAGETARTLSGYFGYAFTGQRISIVLADHADDSNGWASGRDPLVFVDCRPTGSLLRGETDWLRTVLTHELSHVFSLKILNPPVVVRAWVGIESVEENIEVEVDEYAGLSRVPLWFVEGVAQLGSYHLAADRRDPIREMILRDAVLNDSLLTIPQMARFEGTSLDYELVYNQGFSFLLFLEQRYGETFIKDLCRETRRVGLMPAIEKCCGESAGRLYEAWKADLVQRFARPGAWTAGRPMFERSDPMGMEVAAVRSGEYVIANWGNDYTRFSLYRRARGGRYVPVARDTGRVLREDRATGEVWFNRAVYNYQTGAECYDVYRIGADGSIDRITRGSRCLAFDVLEGHLVYARYRDGRTEIVQLRPDGTEVRLHELPADQPVYSISLVSRDLVLLSLGTPVGPRLAVLAGSGLQMLWPECEILDPVSAGDNRVLFAAALDGSPQIYWADPSAEPRAWYRLTGEPGGARFPALDEGSGEARLFYAAFEQGGYRLYAREQPFDRSHPVRVPDAPVEEGHPAEDAGTIVPSGPAPLDPIWSLPTFTVGLASSRYSDGSRIQMDWVGIAGLNTSFYNAPEDLGLDLFVQVAFPLAMASNALYQAFAGGLLGYFDLGPFRNYLEYTLSTDRYDLGGGYTETDFHHDLYAESDYQLTRCQTLAGLYELTWHVAKITDYNSITYLSTHTAGLRWRWADSRRSAFDPAGLGQPLASLQAGADLKYHQFPDPAYNPSDWDLDPHPMGRLLAGAAFRALSPGSRLSAGVRLDGYSYLGGVRNGKPTPGTLSWIGGSGSFSGYPDGYVPVNDLLRATVEAAANPFVRKDDATAWYERLSLGLKLEAGVARYWDGGLQWDYPLSVEAALRFSFFLHVNRESSVFLRAAVPLNDFAGGIERPYQVYLGYGG